MGLDVGQVGSLQERAPWSVGILPHFPPGKEGLGRANGPQCPGLQDAWQSCHQGCLEASRLGPGVWVTVQPAEAGPAMVLAVPFPHQARGL